MFCLVSQVSSHSRKDGKKENTNISYPGSEKQTGEPQFISITIKTRVVLLREIQDEAASELLLQTHLTRAEHFINESINRYE